MEMYRFENLDLVYPDGIGVQISLMIDELMFRTAGSFDIGKYECLMGVELLGRLARLGFHNVTKIVGVDVSPSYDIPTNAIMLTKKSLNADSKKLIGNLLTGYSYVDTGTASCIQEIKNTINERFGYHKPFRNIEKAGNAILKMSLAMKNVEKENKCMNGFSGAVSYALDDVINTQIAYNKMYRKDPIEKVIFNDPATIVCWTDGTKTIVKAQDEPFDPEKGLAMAISKKYFGNEGNYYDIFRKWLPKDEIPEFLIKKMNLPDDSSELLTAKQLAEKIGLSVSTVLRDCRRGIHPGARKVDGKWLIPYSGLVGGSKNDI